MNTDTILMAAADSKANVTGTYYGQKFTGKVISSRQNTVNYREEAMIELDAPLTALGYTRPVGEVIIITGWMIDNGTHSVKVG
jgi:hypothetical protein